MRDQEGANALARIRAGDKQALAELFHQYGRLVYRTAYFILADAQEAEDVMQEVFLQVYRRPAAFDGSKGALTTWLYWLTVNRRLSLRRKKELPTVELSELEPLVVESSAEAGLDEDMWRALQRLSEKLRAVLVLRYYLDLPYSEIARLLGVPVGTVKSRLSAALAALAKELGPELSPDRKGGRE